MALINFRLLAMFLGLLGIGIYYRHHRNYQSWVILPAPQGEPEHPITIISGHYDLKNRSKHSTESYLSWLGNFFTQIDNPMVLYTDKAFLPTLQSMRGDKPTVYRLHEVMDLPPMQPFKKDMETQHEKDPERSLHFPELYYIWDSRPWMVAEAAKNNPFKSEYFFWVDAGAFRGAHNLKQWPNLERVEATFLQYPNRLLLGLINKITPRQILKHWDPKNGTIPRRVSRDLVEGGFFGGKADIVKWYSTEFYRTIHYYIKKGVFIGKDQDIINVVALKNHDQVFFVPSIKQNCSNVWFYFQQYLASTEEANPNCQFPPPLVWTQEDMTL